MRERILTAAWALYDEEGIDGVTLERAAARLGVDDTQIQSHFATRRELTQEMLIEAVAGPVETIKAKVAQAQTGAAALDGYLRGFVGYYFEHPEQFRYAHASTQLTSAAIGVDEDLVRRISGRANISLDVVSEGLLREWGDSELPHGIHPRRLAFVNSVAAVGFLTLRSMMAAAGTTLAHSDEHMISEMSRALASGPSVVRQLGALNEVSSELAKLRTEQELIDRAPGLLAGALEFDRAALWMRQDGALRLVAAEPTMDSGTGEQALLSLDGVPSDRTQWKAPWVTTPIRFQGDPVGLLGGQTPSEELDRRDISRVEVFATLVGLALESVRLYESLNRLVDQRTHQLRQAQELVAGIAHELNTPLGAIRSAQDSLGTTVTRLEARLKERYDTVDDDKRTQRHLQMIHELGGIVGTASGRVDETVARLKSFVRLDQADHQLTDIHSCIDDALHLVSHRIPEGIAVVKTFGELPELRCAPAQLNHLFLNVLDNARLAIEGEGTITITTTASDDRIHVVVEDTGVGIGEDDIKRVFDAGFTTRGVAVGTGLGLSICHQIAKSHHGDIELTSTLGRGTAVKVSLPLGRS